MPQSIAVEVRQEPAREVYAIRHVGPYGEIGQAFARFASFWQDNEMAPVAMIGVFCDDPSKVPAADLVSYACVEMKAATAPPSRGMERLRLPAGAVATATMVGPWETPVHYATYDAVYAFVKGSDTWCAAAEGEHQPFEGAAREYYIDDPEKTPIDRMRTEIAVPVVPR